MSDINVSPPYTNRGADNTQRDGLRACVDWVQVTLKTVTVEQLIEHILGLDFNDFYNGKNGKYGYRGSLHFGHVGIYFDGREDMGIHLEITGQGCREYESLNIQAWKKLFGSLLDYEANFTRIDIAVDDFKGHFKIQNLVRKIKSRELVSKFKNATRIEKMEIETGDSKGNTVYFGGSSSRVQIRMYEKDHERMGQGFDLEDDVKIWNRTEIQARKERSQKIAMLIAERDGEAQSIGNIVSGILKYYLRFVVRGKDINRSRWNTAPFWTSFIGDVEALKLTDIAPDRTIERIDDWIGKQVSPSLALLFEAYDGDMEVLKKFIIDGSKRLQNKDYVIVDRFKIEQDNREKLLGDLLHDEKTAYTSQYDNKQTGGIVSYS